MAAPAPRNVLSFDISPRNRPLRLLCFGAHSDDLEIGCGGTVMEWLALYRQVEVTWVVLSAPPARATEARRSAAAFLRGAQRRTIVLHAFRDGHFPAHFAELKAVFAELASSSAPDVVLAHTLDDRHQDHRLVAELAWQSFRDHLILEYEIPKYEGDLGRPNFFVPLSASRARRKVDYLMRHFPSQLTKGWFRPETFRAAMHPRGIECRSPSGSAEAFFARKIVCGGRA